MILVNTKTFRRANTSLLYFQVGMTCLGCLGFFFGILIYFFFFLGFYFPIVMEKVGGFFKKEKQAKQLKGHRENNI